MPSPDLGTDLQVVPGPPGMAAADGSVLDVGLLPRSSRPPIADLATIRGRENLAQALTLRLLTPRGSLAALGHSEYGSRLGELIGRRKTEPLRALCRAYVLEVVAQEPRVDDKAVSLEFDPASESASELRFTLTVQPRTAGGQPLQLDLAVGV